MQNPALTIPLSYPIHNDGQEITELHLRRPKLREVKLFAGITQTDEGAMQESAFEKVIQMTAALADLPVEVIEEIDAADVEIVMTKVTDFFEKAVPSKTGGP